MALVQNPFLEIHNNTGRNTHLFSTNRNNPVECPLKEKGCGATLSTAGGKMEETAVVAIREG